MKSKYLDWDYLRLSHYPFQNLSEIRKLFKIAIDQELQKRVRGSRKLRNAMRIVTIANVTVKQAYREFVLTVYISTGEILTFRRPVSILLRQHSFFRNAPRAVRRHCDGYEEFIRLNHLFQEIQEKLRIMFLRGLRSRNSSLGISFAAHPLCDRQNLTHLIWQYVGWVQTKVPKPQ